jgi:hypothetical protein
VPTAPSPPTGNRIVRDIVPGRLPHRRWILAGIRALVRLPAGAGGIRERIIPLARGITRRFCVIVSRPIVAHPYVAAGVSGRRSPASP